MLYCSVSGRDNSGHVAAVPRGLTETEHSARKSCPRSLLLLLRVDTFKCHAGVADGVQMFLRRFSAKRSTLS